MNMNEVQVIIERPNNVALEDIQGRISLIAEQMDMVVTGFGSTLHHCDFTLEYPLEFQWNPPEVERIVKSQCDGQAFRTTHIDVLYQGAEVIALWN